MWSSKIDLAYCAGLYEGEGTIHFQSQSRTLKNGSKGRPGRAIRLTIHMTNLVPLELFQEGMDIGKITGPYPGSSIKYKEYYQYRVIGFADCQYIISSLWEWLSPIRRDQAFGALQAYRDWRPINVSRR